MIHKLTKPIFLLFTAICMTVRVWLKLTVIDPATGFYEGSGIGILLFHGVLVGGLILLTLAYLLGKRKNTAVPVVKESPIVRVLSILTGAALLLYASLRLVESLTENAALDLPMMRLLVFGLFLLIFRFALPAAAGFFLITAGIRMNGQDSQLRKRNGWLALTPLLWLIAELLTLFMQYTAIRNVSDQMLTIVTLIAMAPFLLALARILGDVDFEKGIHQLQLFGLPFSLLSLTVSAGLLAGAFTGKTLAIGLPLSGAIFLFCAGLYAGAVCLSIRVPENAS